MPTDTRPRWLATAKALTTSLGFLTRDERRMLCLVLALALLGLGVRYWHRSYRAAHPQEPPALPVPVRASETE